MSWKYYERSSNLLLTPTTRPRAWSVLQNVADIIRVSLCQQTIPLCATNSTGNQTQNLSNTAYIYFFACLTDYFFLSFILFLLRKTYFFFIICICTPTFAGRSRVRFPKVSFGIFHWHNPSGRTMALGSTQPLTEMSTRNISWGVEAAGA